MGVRVNDKTQKNSVKVLLTAQSVIRTEQHVALRVAENKIRFRTPLDFQQCGHGRAAQMTALSPAWEKTLRASACVW